MLRKYFLKYDNQIFPIVDAEDAEGLRYGHVNC